VPDKQKQKWQDSDQYLVTIKRTMLCTDNWTIDSLRRLIVLWSCRDIFIVGGDGASLIVGLHSRDYITYYTLHNKK